MQHREHDLTRHRPGLAPRRGSALTAASTRAGRRRSPPVVDPAVLAALESDAWVAYSRRDWLASLARGSRSAAACPACPGRRPSAARGASSVRPAVGARSRERADRAQRTMERFYRTIRGRLGESWDPATAARSNCTGGASTARTSTCSATGATRPSPTRWPACTPISTGSRNVGPTAAEYRADAMRESDQWIREGRRADSPRLEAERVALAHSYDALLQDDRAFRTTGSRQKLNRILTNGKSAITLVQRLLRSI